MKEIDLEDFLTVELISGTITQVEDFPEARKPAYRVWADFWEKHGVKKTSAQVTSYTKKELLWKQIIWVLNLPKKQVWKFMSEFLLTAFIQEDGKTILAVPDTVINNWEKLM